MSRSSSARTSAAMSCDVGAVDCRTVLATSLGWPTGGPFGAASTAEDVTEGADLTGRVYMVTGATGALGGEVSRVLALRGAHVVLACRDATAGERLVDAIRGPLPDARLTVMGGLELGSRDAVRAFASDFCSRALPLTGIICCAAVVCRPFSRTPDGRESHFGVNHLGHFLLVHLLCGEIIRTAASSGVQGRVVLVSSNAHHFTYRVRRGSARPSRGIDFINLDDDVGYDASAAYAQSKLANVLHAAELEERFRENGVNVAAFAVHPGILREELRHALSFPGGGLLYALAEGLATKTPERAAATVVHCAAADRRRLAAAANQGRYYADCAPRRSSLPARDPRLARNVWEHSERLLGLEPGSAEPRARSDQEAEPSSGPRGTARGRPGAGTVAVAGAGSGAGGSDGGDAMAPPGTLGMGGDGGMPRGGARATPGGDDASASAARNSPPIRVTPTKSGRWGLGLSPAKKPSED